MKKSFFFLVLIILGAKLLAQDITGIVGTKIEGSTEISTLPGATVVFKGTTTGTITNMDGVYHLLNIEPGKYELSFSFMGYQTKTIAVTVTERSTQNLDVILEPESMSIKEVTVTTQFLGQKKAISQQLKALAIVNIISEEKMQELPDVNAAEAIGRLPGIALQRNAGEGEKVIVRGLTPAFTNVTVNGVKLSASESDRSTDLSMISSEMLAGVEVYKSPTPDMDGEAVGGTVNLNLRKAKSNPSARMKLENVYNGLRNDFGNYRGTTVLSSRFFDDKLGIIGQFNVQSLNRGVDDISNDIITELINSETVPFFSLSTLNYTEEKRERLGTSFNVDYKLRGGGLYFSSFYNESNRDQYTRSVTADWDYQQAFYNSSIYNDFKKVISLSLSGDHSIGKSTIDWAVSSSNNQNYNPEEYLFTFNQTGGIVYDEPKEKDAQPEELLQYLHPDPSVTNLEWGYAYPDSIFEKNYSAKFNWETPFIIGKLISGSIKVGGQYRTASRWNKNHESVSGRYFLSGSAPQGLLESFGREMDMYGELIAMSNFMRPNFEAFQILDDRFLFSNGLDADLVKEIYKKDGHNWIYRPDLAKKNEYRANEAIWAAYIMPKIQIGDKLTIITGGRFEYSDNYYEAYKTEAGGSYGIVSDNAILDTADVNYHVFLPHFHLKYKVNPILDIRAVVNQTIGRPTYSQVLPRANYNSLSEPYPSISASNPLLKPTISTNYDFSVTVHEGRIGMLSVGAFYKDIKNSIYKRNRLLLQTEEMAAEWGFPGHEGWLLATYDNNDGKVYGLEAEVQANLNFLPGALSGIVVSANYARLFSETTSQYIRENVEYVMKPSSYPPYALMPVAVKTYVEEYITMPMLAQTPHTFNASIGWDYKGFSARVSAIYQGSRLSSKNSATPILDSYTFETLQIDGLIKYKFKKYISIYSQLSNINGRADRTYTVNEPYYYTSDSQYGYNIITGIQIDF